jgi:hypothetical protein
MSDDSLYCTCDGMGVYETFSVTGEDPWDSCEEAGAVCGRLVEGGN